MSRFSEPYCPDHYDFYDGSTKKNQKICKADKKPVQENNTFIILDTSNSKNPTTVIGKGKDKDNLYYCENPFYYKENLYASQLVGYKDMLDMYNNVPSKRTPKRNESIDAFIDPKM